MEGRDNPLDDKTHEVVRSLLTEKALSLGEQVTELLPKMENFLGVSIAIVIGSVSLGITEEHPQILAILPFFLIVLYVYLLQANTEMLSRAGHKRFLEEEVNSLLGRKVLLEEEYVAPTLHGRFKVGRLSIILIQSLMLVLLLGSIALAIANLNSLGSGIWHMVFWTALFGGLVTLAAAAWEQHRAYEKAHRAAKAGFEGIPPPSTPLVATEDREDVTSHRADEKAATP